ncbi:MAG: CotH kinase family protein [Planctomycetes bacterium]|nr:CotH kinase family protein [Planctomycetota bacterium]
MPILRGPVAAVLLAVLPAVTGHPGAARVLAQDVVISEFLAINESGLTDEDGDRSDWIELYNAGATTVNLEGWALTDDPRNLTKWRFPAVSIPANGFLVVFASDKDRRTPGHPLHTNFKLLGTEGEYLGLIAPSGMPAWEYAPFPMQVADFSYGLSQNGRRLTLVPPSAPVRVLIPADNSLALSWTSPGFNDAGWTAGVTGVGYDEATTYQSLIGTNVISTMNDTRTTAYIRIPFEIDDPTTVSSLILRMKYDDGYIAYINGNRAAERNAPATAAWDSEATQLHDDSAAVNFEEEAITVTIGMLRTGENILAIHGLNDNIGSSDFLIVPEMDGLDAGELDRDVRQYFPYPTPGAGNLEGYPDVSEKPEVYPQEAVFTGSIQVNLAVDEPGTTIRYTTNGTEPTASSPVYTNPISISSSTLVRAKGFSGNLAPSPTTSAAFIALASNVTSFNSDLPVVLVDNFNRGSIPQDPYQPAYMAIFEPVNGRTRLSVDPTLRTRIGIKVRGSSTAGEAKKSYTVEAWDEKDQDKDIAPLDFPPESDWVLHGPPSFDQALIRNAFIYALSNQVGRYAVRTRFVEAFVNTGGGALSSDDYVGIYVFMEKIKRGEDRVNVEELPGSALAEPDIAGGYMFKIDRLDPGDAGFSAGGQRIAYVYPKEENIATEQAAWIKDYIDDFVTALNGSAFRDPEVGYVRYIDVDSWVDHHLLNVLPNNVDALRLSAYMFKKREGRIEWGPVWDFDRSMDSTDSRDDNPEVWNVSGGTAFFDYPWWERLFDDPDFWQKWIDRWYILREGPFSTANVDATIDAMKAELEEAAVRNFQRWSVPARGWAGEVEHVKDWLEIRSNWIDSQFLKPPIFTRPAGPISPGATLSMSGTGGTIYYNRDGTDPRSPGGTTIAPGARAYTGPLSLSGNEWVVARIRTTGGSWSGVRKASYYEKLPRLVVTEIMYHPLPPPPGSPYRTEDFEFIELQNAGDEPIDIAGARFIDGIEFVFPDGAYGALMPGEYVVVVKNLEAFATIYDAASIPIAGEFTWQLENRGEVIELQGPMGEPILRFAYDDEWYSTTDGQGASLVMQDPRGDLATWGLKERWAASIVPGGTPGTGEEAFLGGLQLPGDVNQDSTFDIGDAVSLLGLLFGGSGLPLPCVGDAINTGANLELVDMNGDGLLDLSDAIYGLSYIFASGPPPAGGTTCVRILGCPDVCIE